MSQPAPTASGTLVSTPFSHLLIYALDRRLTGSLVFEDPSRKKHALYLVAGVPALATLGEVVAPLGALAVGAGALPEERLEPALVAAREKGCRLGQILLEWGSLDEAHLERLLAEQLALRALRLAELPAETAYGYYAGMNFLEGLGGPSEKISALSLIWRVFQDFRDPVRTRDVLARLAGAELRFHQDAPLARFEFGGADRAVVDVLSAKPQTLAALKSRGLLEPERVDALVSLFALLRHFDTGTGAAPIGAEPRMTDPPAARASAPSAQRASTVPSAQRASSVPSVQTASAAPAPAVPVTPPPPSPPADDALGRELRALAEAQKKQSYYELLGVAIEAPAPSIAAAYFQLAKRWHPDRIAPERADLRDLAERVFARISEAHQVLSDAQRRSEYDEIVKRGEGSAEEQEQVQRVVRAATNFQKALVFLKRNNLAGAEEAARAALEDAPEEADHVALVAWLEASKPGADVDAAYRTIDKASRSEYANLRIRWYRGQLLKRLGKERQALEDFRFIVEKDPRHVDAQREVRLHEMQRSRGDGATKRSTQPPEPPEKPGFLGKLFKK